jgi:hypothetical protein
VSGVIVGGMTTGWVKSSYSFSNGNCLEWRTSTHSASGACVELRGGVQVRDSQDPAGPVLAFSPAAWAAFAGRLKVLAGP